MKEVPIWEKSNLTLEEAAAYSGIGINKLRSISDSEKCQFVLWIGSKRLIKRKKLDEYTERMYSLSKRDISDFLQKWRRHAMMRVEQGFFL